MPAMIKWKDEKDRLDSEKQLYEQLQNVIDDVGRGMPFKRAVKANDLGISAAKHRYWKGDRALECYREYNTLVEEGADVEDITELFDKYDLGKVYRDNMDLIPASINVQFYIRINKSQGDFIREMITKIREDAQETGNKLNFNATWLLSRVYAGDFGEAMRGAMDIDIGVSDKARSNLNKALDSLMQSKQDKFQQGNSTKTDIEIKKQEGKIERGTRMDDE